MKKIFIYMIMTLVSLILLSACGTPASPATTSEAAPQTFPVTETVATETVVASGVDECVVCHTDKQMLIETAKPEEVAESESKGVG
jgi:hypothetical protein